MQSKIESAIESLQDYVDNCKFQTLSQTRIIVNKEELDSLIQELRDCTPEEIQRYQQMISNRDAILNDAKQKANKLLEQTAAQTQELVNEHEIMQQAYAKANEVVSLATKQAQEILDNATIEANSVKDSAMQYTDQLLAMVEDIVTRASENANANYQELISNLNSTNATVKNNRAELFHNDDDDFENLGIDDQDGSGSGLNMI